MPPEVDDEIDELIRPIRQRYLQELGRYYAQLIPFMDDGARKPLTFEQRQEIQFIAHKFMGNGNTFGFPDITATGTALEMALLAAPQEPDAVIVKHVRSFLIACQDALKKVEF